MNSWHIEFVIQGLPQEGQLAHVSPHFSPSLGRSVTAAALSWGGGAGAVLVGWSCLPPKQDSGMFSPLSTRWTGGGFTQKTKGINLRHPS